MKADHIRGPGTAEECVARTEAASSRGLGAVLAGRSLLPMLLVVGVCYLTYARVLSFWFTGVDIFSLILSNRVDALADLPDLLTREYLAAYAGHQIAGSVGIRPTGQALYALDYWLWNLQPFGYHLTNLTIHALNAVLILVLTRELRLRRGALIGLLAALVFAVHPLHSASVPLQTDRFDMLLGTFTLAALAALLRHFHTTSRASLGLFLLLSLLAFLTKESAIVLLPLAVFSSVVMALAGRMSWSRAAVITAALLAVLASYLTFRSLALQVLGGYPLRPGDSVGLFLLMFRSFFGLLVYPVPFLDASPFGGFVARALPSAFALVFLLWCAIGLERFAVAPRRPPRFAVIERILGDDAFPLWLVSCWVLAFLPMYVVLLLTTGVFKSLYLYTAMALWCIALIGLLVHAVRAAYTRHSRPSAALPARLASVVGIVLVLSFLVGSPPLRKFDQWGMASALGRDYVEALGTVLPSIPDGSTVFLVNLPHGIDCVDTYCVGESYVFEDYSIDSWLRLTHPERRIQFVAVSTVWVEDRAPLFESRISGRAAAGVIAVENSGGRMDPPWHSTSDRYLEATIEPLQMPRRMSIRLVDDVVLDGTYYVFDYFEPRRLFKLGPGGPQTVTP